MPLLRRQLFLSLFLSCCLLPAFGQDSTMIAKSSFGLGTGYAYSALKNEKYSPLTLSGSGVPVQAYFRQWRQTHQLHVQVFYSSLSLSSDVGILLTNEKNIHLQFASHYRLGQGKRKIKTWAGFVLDGQTVQRSFSSKLGNGTAGNNSSNETFVSLNPSVLFEDPIGKDKLSLQVWASVAAYVIRTEDAVAKASFESIGSFSKTEARLSYSKYFRHNLEGRLDGQFQFYAMAVSEQVYKVNTQVIFSIAYKL
jgi:hypothetical protein